MGLTRRGSPRCCWRVIVVQIRRSRAARRPRRLTQGAFEFLDRAFRSVTVNDTRAFIEKSGDGIYTMS